MAAIPPRSTSARPPASIMSAPRPTASRSRGWRRRRPRCASAADRSGRRRRRRLILARPLGEGAGLPMLALGLERLALAHLLGAQPGFLAIAPLPFRAGEEGHAEKQAEQEREQQHQPLVGREGFHGAVPPYKASAEKWVPVFGTGDAVNKITGRLAVERPACRAADQPRAGRDGSA